MEEHQKISLDTNIQQAQAAAQSFNTEAARTRLILRGDQLAELVSPRARLETGFKEHQAYLFSIDGVLNGKKIQGAMFAGQCMLVFAMSEAKAQEQANAGLRTTIELLHEEFDTRNQRTVIEEGLTADIGGRRAKEGSGNYPKLNAIMRHIIGGEPYKF